MRNPKQTTEGDRYRYRDGQAPVTVFIDKIERLAFTLLCHELGTDKSNALRAYVKRVLQTGRL